MKKLKKKSTYKDLIRPLDLARVAKVFGGTRKFIEDFSLFIKQCYHIFCRVEKIQKVKIQKLQAQKNRRIMLLSKCAVRDSKKLKFMKQEEARGLLSSLGRNIPY